MTIIHEGGLRFDFHDDWEVRRGDDAKEFYGQLLRASSTRAVDFVAWSADRVVFIEVKDFRNAWPENRARLLVTVQATEGAAEKLWTEVVHKTRDTLYGLVARARAPGISNAERWSAALHHWCPRDHDALNVHPVGNRTKAWVVLWLELDHPESRERRGLLNAALDRLKRELQPLQCEVRIWSREVPAGTLEAAGLRSVTNLPGAHRGADAPPGAPRG